MSDDGKVYCTVRIDDKKCQRCFHCIFSCPGGALSYFKGAFEHDPEKCNRCENCQDSCENKAIKVVWE